MGQKVNPHGLRVGVIKNWDSRWFVSDKEFGDNIVSDCKIREYVKTKLQGAGVPKIEIERDKARVRVFIQCAKPGVVIGFHGAEIARTEHYHEGTIPLQTLRADIDYGFWEANTTYGKIGIKVWIYKGEVLNEVNRTSAAAPRDNRRGDRRDNRNGERRGRRPEGARTPREGGRK